MTSLTDVSSESIYHPELAAEENVMLIREWIAAKIGEICGRSIEVGEYGSPFSIFDIDSVDAVSLLADLEEVVPISLPPTLLLDKTTIDELATYLVDVCAIAFRRDGETL